MFHYMPSSLITWSITWSITWFVLIHYTIHYTPLHVFSHNNYMKLHDHYMSVLYLPIRPSMAAACPAIHAWGMHCNLADICCAATAHRQLRPRQPSQPIRRHPLRRRTRPRQQERLCSSTSSTPPWAPLDSLEHYGIWPGRPTTSSANSEVEIVWKRFKYFQGISNFPTSL